MVCLGNEQRSFCCFWGCIQVLHFGLHDDCSHEIKRHLFLRRKTVTDLDSIFKSRNVTLPTKVHNNNVQMWELDHKEGWAPKNWCFWIVMLEKTLESSWTERSNHSSLKEINPKYSLEGLMLKLQYFGHLMWRADSLEKTLMLGKIEGKWRRRQQKMRWLESITGSVDMNLSKLQEILESGEPGMLQSLELQRVRHDLATEQQQLDNSGWMPVIKWRIARSFCNPCKRILHVCHGKIIVTDSGN